MILGLCATRRRALEEQTTFFAHYYIQYVSDRLNSSSNPEVSCQTIQWHCQTKRA